jgi:hypothetical protein|tara:strand:+ start:405 stop:695 length:291 start_codon:yes stop_codon:yes gene_type:complete
MQHFIKLYEETKKLNSNLTQYEFSTEFLHKKRSYFVSLKQRNLYPSYKTLVQLSHTYSNLAEVVKDEPKLQTQYYGLMKLKTAAEKLAEQRLYENI